MTESVAGSIERYSCYHFSLANARDEPEQGSIPVLLRRVADLLDQLGESVDVLDITFQAELDDQGSPWPVVTVYYTVASE